MPKFLVEGQHSLKGEIGVSGSKNATLPILAACLLTDKTVTLTNVPDISDVHAFLEIMRGLNVKAEFNKGRVIVDAKNAKLKEIDPNLAKKMRASILLLGPMLARFKSARLAFPGGCVLGKRSIGAHLHALTSLGAEIVESSTEINLRAKKLRGRKIFMTESSVTATENAIMAAIAAEGITEIRWAAMEPHVQDLCHFLVKLGAKIDGIGTTNLRIKGPAKLRGGEYKITPDYLEVGTYALAAVLTNGTVKIKNIVPDHLDSFWQKLEEVGANFELGKNYVQIKPHGKLVAVEKLQTAVHPAFPTDLQAPFAVLLTQCEGTSKIHETLFEGRLNYLAELERMGASAEILNPHQALVRGARQLKGAQIVSHDIRAGAAMVLAALIAKGQTEISDINYIDRGYEELDVKLRQLGAKIERIQD